MIENNDYLSVVYKTTRPQINKKINTKQYKIAYFTLERRPT